MYTCNSFALGLLQVWVCRFGWNKIDVSLRNRYIYYQDLVARTSCDLVNCYLRLKRRSYKLT